MAHTDISAWLKFALQQTAAESYLDGIDLSVDDDVRARLRLGNNRLGFELGTTRFTGTPTQGLQDQAFVDRYRIVNHHANDSTGFSATLMQERGTNNFTLSFRSTEYQSLTDGGDRARDLFGAATEISIGEGFAIGQLLAMESYYQSLKDSVLLPVGAVLNVTGYSLGGHLATVFTELHSAEINHTYTFNGAGRGHITGGLQSETTEAEKIAGMLALFKQVLFNPDSGLEIFSDRDNAAYNAAKQIEAQPFSPFVSDTTPGSAGSIYGNARYAWASEVVAVRYQMSSVTLPPGEIGTGVAFSPEKFTQLYGHATQDDRELVVNSGVHGLPQAIYIEDQPNFDGLGGLWEHGDYGTTHSITLIVDSLATQELFQTVAPALTQSDIEAIFAAASNQRASGFVGISGTAEGDSLENALDALGRIFVPQYTSTPAGRQTADFASLSFRNPFYENMAAIRAALSNITMVIEPFVEMGLVDGRFTALPRMTQLALVAEARQDTDRGLAFRYALENMNPFAVIGADYHELGHASNGQLTLYDPATGFGQLTEQYLTDRAAFLGAKIQLNLRNAATSGDTIHYRDFEGDGYDLPTGSFISTDQEFLFGSNNDDPALVGGSQEDHLYGGGGQDLLDGQGGRDYLEGNDGNDVLFGGTGRDFVMGQQGNDLLDGGDDDDRLTGGLDDDELRGGSGLDVYYSQAGSGSDTITDSDGRGVIQTDQRLLVGGMRKPMDSAQAYTSLDGQFIYVRSGSTLTITNQQSPGHQIVIDNYAPEQLGIRLVDVSSAPFQNNGLPTRTNEAFSPGDIDETSNRLILDGPFNYAVHTLGGNDSVVGGSGNDELYGDGGTDSIDGMEGHDRLYGGAGGDTLRGGAGDDWLLGGDGEDDLDGGPNSDYLDAENGDGAHLLSGGTGSDILVGSDGRDLMYGDTRDHSLISAGGDDYLYGGAGDDGGQGYGLQGGAGSDVVIGGEGNDWLLGDGPNNIAIVWDVTYDGRDWLDGGPGDDALVGGANDDILVGGPGADHLTGDYNNVLFEAGGNDLLDGGDDADTLIGGVGSDTLYGGAGDDVLYGDNNPHLSPALAGDDDFLDGEAGDDQLFGGMGNDVLLGGLGDDRLHGEGGHDFLDGGTGNDALDGGAGFDTIHGGGGNDRLVAGHGSGSIHSGMDQLYGDAGDDYLISASESLDTDNSFLVGGSGDDTYEVDGVGDVVSEVADGGIDTVISYLSSYTLGDDLENLSFGGGLALVGVGNTLSNVLTGARSLQGLAGDDTLRGVGWLDGGTGNDILQGGSGASYFDETDGLLQYLANVYVFEPNFGQDRIIENDAVFNSAYYQNEDSVSFSEGIEPGDVTWERSGNDLILSVGGGADRITIPSYYNLHFDRGGYQIAGHLVPSQGNISTGVGFSSYVAPSRIELVQFTDGTMWDATHFGAPLLGDLRADTYYFQRGSGDVSIIDFDVWPSNSTRELDSVLVGADLLPSDVVVSRVGDDLALTVNGTTDRLNIQSFFKTVTAIPPFSFSGYSVAPYRIEQVRFADGTLWTASALTNGISTFTGTSGADTLFGNQLDNVIQGLSGDDYLSGQGGNDVFDGGVGNDHLFGDAGNDTYLFGRGGGQDTLVSYDPTGTDMEIVRLGADVLSSDVTIQVVGTGNDLALRINGTNDQLVFDEFLWRSDYRIDRLEFYDGTVWDAATILDRALGLVLVGTNQSETLRGSMLGDVLDGLNGSDVLIGGQGDDRLVGGPGDDELSGDAGDDTYVFNVGDGVDTIYDQVAAGEGNRILFGPEILLSDLAFMRDESQRALTIQVGSSGADRLEIIDFDPTFAEGSLVVATLVFEDGSTLSLADLFPPNHAPIVVNPLMDQTILEDAPFSFLVPSDTFADEDADDVLSLTTSLANGDDLPSWLRFDSASRTFNGTPDDAHVGTLHIRVRATDPDGESVLDVFTLTVGNVNEAPMVAEHLPDQVAIEDTAFTYTVPVATFTDADQVHGDTLSYSASLEGGGDLPVWLTFEATTRTFSGVAGNGEVGTLAVIVTATDSELRSIGTGFRLAIQNTNDGPIVAEPLPDQMAAEDALFSFRIPDNTFTDPDHNHGDVLEYAATLADGMALPPWLTFSAERGDFSGTPGPGDAGSLQVRVTATDTGALSASNQFALIVSGPLPITLVGTANADVLTGGRGDDTLISLEGDDLLLGGEGNDLLDGGSGLDTMEGGAGDETYIVDSDGDIVTESQNQGVDTVWSSVSYTLPNHVEHLSLTGTAAIKGTGNALNNILVGNSGNNSLNGRAGDDRLDGGLGTDTMIGGTGNDVYVVSQVGDMVSEALNEGIDTVESSITYMLGNHVENLLLTGLGNLDGTGNSSNNHLIGNDASNVLKSGSGNDIVHGQGGDDALQGGSGDDQLFGGQGDDYLNAGSGDDVLDGGDGSDILVGGSGDDQLFGGVGDDMLTGGSGADHFIGGDGTDTTTGGSGNDRYSFSRGDGQDTIIDSDSFSGNQDRVLFGTAVNPLDLVIARQAHDLRLTIYGSADQVTIQNWYLSTNHHVEMIQADNGQTLLSTQVDQLIQAMAAFSQESGLTWDQAIDQRPQDVQTVLAASWQ